MRSSKMRLKASKPCMPANSHELYSIRHFYAFAVGTVHLKKPSVGPKGLIGPPCHGAPGRRRQNQGNWPKTFSSELLTIGINYNNISYEEKMSQIEMIEELVEPLVKSGVYKDRISAFRAIIIDYIDRKRTEYNGVISCFEKKYQKDFEDFSKSLTNCAAVEEEDDWMEWKGAIEMLKGWDEAYRLSIHGQAV